jgi:hypothetical protein
MSQQFIQSVFDALIKNLDAKKNLEALLQESADVNQALESQLQESADANIKLKVQIQKSLTIQKDLGLEVQAITDTKDKLERQLLHQTEVSACLRKKNLELLRAIKHLGDDKTMLQATQEIHKGIISDLKESLHEEQLEKNYFEKVCTNTTELYTIFEEHEPFIMEIVPVPMKIQLDYLQEFGSTTKC